MSSAADRLPGAYSRHLKDGGFAYETGTHVMLAQTTACWSWPEDAKPVFALMRLFLQFGLVSSDISDNFNHNLLPLPAVWTLPGRAFVGLDGYFTRSQLSV